MPAAIHSDRGKLDNEADPLIVGIALALLIAAMAGWASYHLDQINLTTLDAWLASLGRWAPIGHVMLFAIVIAQNAHASPSDKGTSRVWKQTVRNADDNEA